MSPPESSTRHIVASDCQLPRQPLVQHDANRLGGFDIVRVLAALGVVILHASAPYLVQRMPGLTWPVFDTPSHFANIFGWSIELFIMPLFLLMAGYFSPAIFRKQAGWGFVRHRFQRLMIPLAVAMVLILPADLYIWLTGWLIEGLVAPRKIQSLKFDNGIDDGLWGLSHLWFLLYLFLYAITWAGVKQLFHKYKISWPLSTTATMASLAVLGWVILVSVPQVVFGFQHAFLPVPSKYFYSGTFFLGGIVLADADKLRTFCSNHSLRLLLVGWFATALGVYIGCRMLQTENDHFARILATLLTVFAAWTVSLGAVGWAMATRYPSSKTLRYLAAASFWVYLVHHPIVGLCHIQLKVVVPHWPSEVKMLTATAMAIAFALLSFEVMIRRWPFAGLLGTPREFTKSFTTSIAIEPKALETNDESAAETTQRTHSTGGIQACQGVSSMGLSPRPWRASSSALSDSH